MTPSTHSCTSAPSTTGAVCTPYATDSHGRPRLRPGCAPLWESHTRLTIGPHPSLVLDGPLENLAPIAAWVTTLDGSLPYSAVVEADPHLQPILDALISAGCVLAPKPVTSRDAHVPVSASALAEATSRVADDLADDSGTVARSRLSTGIAVVGSLPLVQAIEDICRGAGVQIVDAPWQHTHPGARTRNMGRTAQIKESPAQMPAHAVIIATFSPTNDPMLATHIADEYQRLGVPHMCVSVAGSRMTCGPWVIPGVSTCTRCWQLTQRHASTSATSASCGDPSLIVSTPPKPATHAISLAAAVAAGRALAFADGLLPEGCSEVLAWDAIASIATVSVAPHPACGCT